MNYTISFIFINLPDEPTGKTNGIVMTKNIIEIRVSKFETASGKYFLIGSNSKQKSITRSIQAESSEKVFIAMIKDGIIDIFNNYSERFADSDYSYEIKFVFNIVNSIEGKVRFDDTVKKSFRHFEYPKLKIKISGEERKLFFRAVNELTDNTKQY